MPGGAAGVVRELEVVVRFEDEKQRQRVHQHVQLRPYDAQTSQTSLFCVVPDVTLLRRARRHDFASCRGMLDVTCEG
eukprot:117957-Rhodomonas_salina.1